MRFFTSISLALAVLILLGALTVPARATDYTWYGFGVTSNWTDNTGNWDSSEYPGYFNQNDTATFGSPAGRYTTTVSLGLLTVAGVTYTAPGYSLTVSTQLITTGGITATSANAPNLSLSGQLYIGNAATVGNLSGSGLIAVIDASQATLTVMGSSSDFTGTLYEGSGGSYGTLLTTVGDGTDTASLTLAPTGVANNYSGTTLVNTNATLVGGTTNALSANSAHVVNGTLDLSGGSSTIASLSGTGTVYLHANTLTINSGGTTFGGSITGTGGSLTKTGTGTLSLTGTNAYTGLTTVSGGRLAVNGSIAGSADVQNGGTLGGTGAIGGAVTVESGGTLAPGNSTGQMTLFNSLTLNSGSLLQIEFNGTTSGLFDQLDVRGTFTAGGTLDLGINSGYTPTIGDSFNIFNGPTPGFDSGSFIITSNFTSGLRWNTSELASEGIVSIEAVPEPSTWALLGVSLLFGFGLAVWRRRCA